MIDENDDYFRENPWMKQEPWEESEAVREAEYLRDLAHALRMFADSMDAPHIVPSTKETMALAMRTAATKLEQAADAVEACSPREVRTCEITPLIIDIAETACGGYDCSVCHRRMVLPGMGLALASRTFNYCPSCGSKVASE